MLGDVRRWAAFALLVLAGGTMLDLVPEVAASGHRFEHILMGYGDFPLFTFEQEGKCAGQGQLATVFVDVSGPAQDSLTAIAICGGIKVTDCTASLEDSPGHDRCSYSGPQTVKGSPLCLRTFRGPLDVDSVWTIRCIFNSGIPI